MKRSVSLVFVSLFLLSCATTPPPRIEENYYQNHQYGFVLELPEGAWKPTKKIPAQFSQGLVAQGISPSKIALKLFNNETQATIMVFCERRKGDLSAVSHNQLLDDLEKLLEKHREELLSNDMATSVTYNVWFDNPIIRYTFNLDVVDQIMRFHTTAQGFLYQLGDKIYGVTVTLVSNVLTYEQNLETFNQMWASFRYGEEYTAEQ